MALREIIASFGTEVDSKPLDSLEKRIEAFKERTSKIAEAIVEVFAVRELAEFVEKTVTAGSELKVMSDRLGMSTDELQAMQVAAGTAGVAVDAMTTGLRFLNRNMAEAASGGAEQAQTFRTLHIALKDVDGQARPASEIMGDLADRISKMEDPAKKTRIAMQLLGRGGAELIPLLNGGREAFDQAREAMGELGGGLSKEFTEQAHHAEVAGFKLKFAWSGVKSTIVSTFLPGLEKVMETLAHYVVIAKHVLERTNAVKNAFSFAKILLVVGALKQVVTVLRAIAAGEGLVDLLSPWAWMILAVGALYLIFDDLATLLKGGKSLIGDYLGPEKQAYIDALKASLKDLSDWWDKNQEGIEQAGKALINGLITELPKAIKLMGDLVMATSQAVQLFAAVKNGDWKAIDKIALANSSDQVGFAMGTIKGQTLNSSTGEPNTGHFLATGVPALEGGQGPLRGGDVHQEFHFGEINVPIQGGGPANVDAAKKAGHAVGQGITDHFQDHLQNGLNAVKKF